MEQRTESTSLHLLLSAARDAVLACQRMVDTGDTVLLLADGVMVLAEERPPGFGDGVDVVYNRTDIEARGLVALAAGAAVAVVADRDLPPLLRRHRHCVSWK